MSSKTFLGKFWVVIAGYENLVSLLLVANSETQALEVLNRAAAEYYGAEDEEPSEHGYSSNGGEVRVKPESVYEIGVATFHELKKCFRVKLAANVVAPELSDSADLGSLKTSAATLTRALQLRAVPVTKSVVLDAMASGLGQTSWQSLQARFKPGGAPGATEYLYVLPSVDGPQWNLYATFPASVSVLEVTTKLRAWLDDLRMQETAKDGEDLYTADAVHAKVRELGGYAFKAIETGPHWD